MGPRPQTPKIYALSQIPAGGELNRKRSAPEPSPPRAL